MKEHGLITLFIVPFLFSFLGNAFGLPCKSQTANIGETMNQVAEKCGDAISKEHRIITVEEADEEGIKSSTVAVINEWTYDSGPEELVQLYRFENDKLVKISIPGNGMVRDFSFDTCRNGRALAVGDSMVDTYLKCGDPIAREQLQDKIEETESKGIMRRTYIPISEWTYRYGPDAPGYTITFEDGVAVNIRTREFGK